MGRGNEPRQHQKAVMLLRQIQTRINQKVEEIEKEIVHLRHIRYRLLNLEIDFLLQQQIITKEEKEILIEELKKKDP